jgi:hypothetical protein
VFPVTQQVTPAAIPRNPGQQRPRTSRQRIASGHGRRASFINGSETPISPFEASSLTNQAKISQNLACSNAGKSTRRTKMSYFNAVEASEALIEASRGLIGASEALTQQI